MSNDKPKKNEHPGNTPEVHFPMRDDNVAEWLKWHRDAAHPPFGEGYNTLDVLLDEYRELADTGRSLRDKIDEEPEDLTPAERRMRRDRKRQEKAARDAGVPLSIPDEWKAGDPKLEQVDGQ